jgi:hypothetical protein
MDLDALPWNLLEAINDAWPLLFRRREFPDAFPKGEFPHRLNVFWQMSESSSNGIPEDAESDRIRVFEDRIVETTEHDQQSVLSLVVTGKSQREYVFHTRSPDEFLRRLIDMPQELERYPIEIYQTEDSTWEYVDRVLGEFRWSEA